MRPTKEQVKELWEWCGFEYKIYPQYMSWYPQPITGWYNKGKYYGVQLPYHTLDNLFKYAVPKSKQLGYEVALRTNYQEYKDNVFTALLQKPTGWLTTAKFEVSEDPALALFWAIYKVMKGGDA